MYQRRRNVQKPKNALEASIAIELELSLKHFDGQSFLLQSVSPKDVNYK